MKQYSKEEHELIVSFIKDTNTEHLFAFSEKVNGSKSISFCGTSNPTIYNITIKEMVGLRADNAITCDKSGERIAEELKKILLELVTDAEVK